MPDSNRMRDLATGAIAGAGIAATALVLLLTFLAADQMRTEREYREYAAKHAGGEQQGAPPPLLFCRRLQAEKESPTAQECAQAREYADLDAQEGMWAVGVFQAFIGFAGLIGLGFTVFYARKAWSEARETAAQARRSADIAERDLIERDRPELAPVLEDDRGVREGLDAKAEGRGYPNAIIRPINTGGRTAIVEGYEAKFFLERGDPPKPSPTLFTLLRRRLVVPASKDFIMVSGYAIWSPEEIAAIFERELTVYLVGYITYTDRTGGLWECGFTYWYWPIRRITRATGEKHAGGFLRQFDEGEAFNFDRPRQR